jgi:hypothetical protein
MPKLPSKSPNQIANNAKSASKQSLKPMVNPIKPMMKPNFNAQRPMNPNVMRPKNTVGRRSSTSR